MADEIIAVLQLADHPQVLVVADLGRRGLELKDDLAGGIHFEHAPGGVLTDHRVAVGEPLAGVGAAAMLFGGLVLERDFAVRSDLGNGHTVGEENVAVREHPGVVRQGGGMRPEDASIGAEDEDAVGSADENASVEMAGDGGESDRRFGNGSTRPSDRRAFREGGGGSGEQDGEGD